jgi:hypothetical protein
VLGPASTGLAAAASRARRVCDVGVVDELETRFATVISGSIERRGTLPALLPDVYMGAFAGRLFVSLNRGIARSLRGAACYAIAALPSLAGPNLLKVLRHTHAPQKS